MGSIHIKAAQPIGDAIQPAVTIIIDEAGGGDFYVDSLMLASTLIDTLPGGTLDRMLTYLMWWKASQLLVAYGTNVEAT